jgi:hypothetical protein
MFPPPQQYSQTIKKTWDQVSSLLCTEVTSEGDSSRCSIKILDVAFISTTASSNQSSPQDNEPTTNKIQVNDWLYTSKKGEITRKKNANLSLSKVYERFTRFALANPQNASGGKNVAVLFCGGGGVLMKKS